ncbi:DNA topoisomerase IV subunit B [Thermobifida fusca]|uniref:DNA topoisomerase (ATP-hydrolyzing) n=3 Tax=Thermobifida fusca TaxID=2021 RepID=A0A9P2WQ40_THEFU|nr:MULTISPECIES: DNA topoisomerase IV subunit B [Thermobifida]AAZ56167.1 DNA topoisomerase (ATP-hydrolyzing) [Thermobifida fusca YX]EOR70770.1 DNA topoisomerase IV subunit B [Thermobifida fusca TM51]MBO2530240.1 type IIA DNA topoisomerase subunit B [Thermobifida sp.]MDD6792276.1 DNA topoisomerase IV subunit B [Thermobifida fusca]PPS94319.1 DNA topoisomerase IV subunit B [Thermobifida fusca]
MTAALTTDFHDPEEYSARHLSVLEGLEAVRKRPGMYIGSTDSRGLTHCMWEIIDNSVDEALAGYCTRIEVVLHADGSVEVRDNGRGIPVDIEPSSGLSGVELVMTKLHAGGKFGSGSYTASGGLHGVGASVVNALSARLDVEVDRGGHTYAMSFRRGIPGVFDMDGPDAGFTPRSGLEKIRKIPAKVTGTRVRFWADRQIFLKDAEISREALVERARQTAFLVPGLSIAIRDERTEGEEPYEEEFRFDGGIGEFCDYLAPDTAVSPLLRIEGSGTFTETVPVLDDQGHMVPTDVERRLDVDIALRWGTGYDTVVRSFVNVIATPKGGTHVSGFERALVRVINDQLRATKLLKANDEPVTKEDVLEGLTAVVTVRLPEPQFEGQTKEVLGTSAASRIVSQIVSQHMRAFLTSTKRAEKQQARTVLEKIVNAAKARLAARQQRETQRRKNALENSALPAKLVDCRSEGLERSELFIVEGDSALGTAKLARDSEFQALLPIRGKILNVQKASVADMLKNAECAAIIQVIGAGSGRTFDLDAARYGRVILMADADVDGAHIRCLLLTLFYRYMRPMLEAGRVFAAVPPLHRIELTNVRRKRGARPEDRYIYTYSDAELHQKLAELAAKGITWKEPVQRYKGLGEMDADQLAETTMDPRYRTLRRIRLKDAAEAEAMFELLMGNEVAPRRAFIAQGARELDPTRIDT